MRPMTLRYRTPDVLLGPPPGTILMGSGPRVKRAYRVLGSRRSKSPPALGIATWLLHVEPMPAARGREEIDAGAPFWGIEWDRRG
jgi:hypothetical protein